MGLVEEKIYYVNHSRFTRQRSVRTADQPEAGRNIAKEAGGDRPSENAEYGDHCHQRYP